jgi:hypothetical protein
MDETLRVKVANATPAGSLNGAMARWEEAVIAFRDARSEMDQAEWEVKRSLVEAKMLDCLRVNWSMLRSRTKARRNVT